MNLLNFRIFFFLFLTSSLLINFLIVVSEYSEYTNNLLRILSYTLIGFIILILFFDVIIIIINKFFKDFFRSRYIEFLIIFLLLLSIGSNINPHVAELDQLSDYSLYFNIVISILVTLIILFKPVSLIMFRNFLIFIISTTIILLLSTLFFNLNENTNFKEKSIVSKKLNVFVISFDNLSSSEMYETIFLKKHKNSFLNFIYFNNAISKAPGSASSLAFDIIGNYHLDEHQKYQQYLNKYINADKGNILNRDDIKTETFGYYNMYRGKDRLLDYNTTIYNIFYTDFNRFFQPSLQRFFTSNFQNTLIKTGNHLASRESMNQFNLYQKAIERSSLVDDTVVNLGHWSFTHYPNIYDENCKLNDAYDITHKTTQRDIQDIELQLDISSCAVKKMLEFIDILKQKNIYDNSLIILKSDHGPPAHIYPKNTLLSKTSGDSIYGYARHRPFLMIKPPFHNSPLKENKSLIFLSDIESYVCKKIDKYLDENSEFCKDDFNYIEYAVSNNKIVSHRNEQVFYDNGQNRHRLDENKSVMIDITLENYKKKLSNIFDTKNNNDLNSCFIFDPDSKSHSNFKVDYELCLNIKKNKENILFFGDGLAAELGSAFLRINGDEYNPIFILGSGCLARYWDEEYNDFDGNDCREMNKFTRNFIDSNKDLIDNIVIISHTRHTVINLKKIEQFGLPITLLGPLPAWNKDIRDIISLSEVNDKNYRRPLDSFNLDTFQSDNEMVEKINLEDYKYLRYISLIKNFCDEIDCLYKIPNKINPIFSLNPLENKLTNSGADFIANKYISTHLK